jgi:hypothetical protein
MALRRVRSRKVEQCTEGLYNVKEGISKRKKKHYGLKNVLNETSPQQIDPPPSDFPMTGLKRLC